MDLDRAVGEHRLDGLALRERLPERLAFPRASRGDLERPRGRPSHRMQWVSRAGPSRARMSA